MYEDYTQNYDNTIRPRGMKWFKFLIYFLLFVGALSCLSNAAQHFSGNIHLSQGLSQYQLDGLYFQYPAHKTLDLACGLFYIVIAACYIVVRFRLASYRRNAPSLLLAIPLINASISILYTVLSHKILAVDISAAAPHIIGTAMSNGIFFWLNSIYFDKRKHLFVN